MSLKKMKKEDLELLSNKDITNLILQESKKSMNTADLFKKIIELLNLPKNTFEKKIGDYYTALSTDKRFILLEDGTWDLRTRHTSDKIVKITEEEEEEPEDIKDEQEEAPQEDNYDDNDEEDYDDEATEELKDLVVIDEEELELEE